MGERFSAGGDPDGIEWTPGPDAAAPQHVRIDQRRRHALVTEQLLNGADIRSVPEEVGRKAVALTPRSE
jgi:hypothetical protein